LLTIKKARIISARGSNTHALNQLNQLQQEAQSGRPKAEGLHALLLDFETWLTPMLMRLRSTRQVKSSHVGFRMWSVVFV